MNNDLPLDYRLAETKYIMQCILAGDSCSVIGASGMAKSNLFRHLLYPEVQRHYLANAPHTYLFLAADSHALGELSEEAMYGLLLNRLIEEAQAHPAWQERSSELRALNKKIAAGANVLSIRRTFVKAVQSILAEPSCRLVFLFDQFDEVYKILTPRFFANLRNIRDTFKYRVSYITFTRDELPRLCQAEECEEFYELLQPHILGLGPYNYQDCWIELNRIAKRYDVRPRKPMCERLILLAGGHPGLLKAAFMNSFDKDEAWLSSNDEAVSVLLSSNDVKTECSKLWKSLGEEERDALHVLALGNKPARTTDILQLLQLKGLINKDAIVVSPAFAEYVIRLSTPKTGEVQIRVGPILIDKAGEVWIEGRKLVPSLTPLELRLLTYLCKRPSQLCSKDEIIFEVHQVKTENRRGYSDEALAALVERLRKRIEDDPSRPKLVLTVHGKGYILKV